MENRRNQKNGWVIALIGAIVVMAVAFVAVMAVLFERGSFERKSEDDDIVVDESFEFNFGFGDREVASEDEEESTEEESTEEESDVVSDDRYLQETSEEYSNGRSDYYGDYYNDEAEWMTTFYNDGYDKEDFGFIDTQTGEWYYEMLKDALKSNLDYQIEWKEFQYDTEFENVSIWAVYPQIVSDTMPNVDYLNEAIAAEIDFWTTTYEDYLAEGYVTADEVFSMDLSGYVTYMDEDILSVVFYEEGMDEEGEFSYLYSVNIDVKDGIILDNASIIDIDEEFAVEFRTRNAQQNQNTSGVDAMSDQEIVENLTSPTMGAVFYTPLGLEVGINVDYGWNSVTFTDYEKYLKQL